jgi:hypothetical protein
MYAWGLVQVYASGRIHLDVHGFDERFGVTRLLVSRDLQPGQR